MKTIIINIMITGGKRREHVSSPSFQSLFRALGWNAERVDGRNNCSTENTVKLSFVFTIISCKWSIYLFIFAISVVTNQIRELYCLQPLSNLMHLTTSCTWRPEQRCCILEVSFSPNLLPQPRRLGMVSLKHSRKKARNLVYNFINFISVYAQKFKDKSSFQK